jgi:hypothetical protein
VSESRAAAIQQAVLRELATRREYLDRAADLGEVQVTVKLQAGTAMIRSVTWSEERVAPRGRTL